MLREFVNIVKTKTITVKILKALPIGNEVALLTGSKTIQYAQALLDKAFLNNGEVLAIPVGGTFNIKYHKGSYYNANNYILEAIDSLNARYLYYTLLNNAVQISELYKGWGCKQLKLNDLLSVELFKNGIPSLQKQEEIVQILDTLTTHTTELTAKLTARKKQYEYYRGKLLTFGEGVEWKKLGEVCEFQNGFAFKSNLFKDSGVPIIRITNVDGVGVDLSNVKYFNPNDYKEKLETYKITYGAILIAMSGATTGKIGFYSDDNVAYLNQRVGKFVPIKDVLNNRYLYHYLLSQVENIYIMAGGGVQPNLSSNILMSKLPIPLPPLSVQKEIVETLDKFDALTNSTTEGLPKEIELRQKQYEYYRNELLNFK